MNKKKALLLCASHNDLGTVRALRKLGYYIIVTGNIENAPGERWCDKYVKADYSNKEHILQIAKDEAIDAIVQCCNDFGVYTAAYVAEKMGLPGYDSYETTITLHNKDKFKKFALKNGIKTPEAYSFWQEKEAYVHLKNCQYPVIIKPVDASAGNGIKRADDYNEAEAAVKYAFAKSREKRIVIETFITGTQHGFCTFLKNKKVTAVCSNNEYSFENPYRVEIDTFPADNFNNVKDFLIDEIEKIAELLSLKDGIFHLQYIYDGKTPQIIEVMRRILGNMYHVPGNMITNMDWEYWETRSRCGLPLVGMPVMPAQEGFYAYKTILAPYDGVIEEFCIPPEYKSNIVSEYWLKHEHDKITHYLSEPIGFLFFMFKSQEEMKKIVKDGYVNNIIKMR